MLAKKCPVAVNCHIDIAINNQEKSLTFFGPTIPKMSLPLWNTMHNKHLHYFWYTCAKSCRGDDDKDEYDASDIDFIAQKPAIDIRHGPYKRLSIRYSKNPHKRTHFYTNLEAEI